MAKGDLTELTTIQLKRRKRTILILIDNDCIKEMEYLKKKVDPVLSELTVKIIND